MKKACDEFCLIQCQIVIQTFVMFLIKIYIKLAKIIGTENIFHTFQG